MMAMEWCVHYGVLSNEEAKTCSEILSKWKASGGRTGFGLSQGSEVVAKKEKKMKTTIVGEGVSDVGIEVGSGTVAIGGVSSM